MIWKRVHSQGRQAGAVCRVGGVGIQGHGGEASAAGGAAPLTPVPLIGLVSAGGVPLPQVVTALSRGRSRGCERRREGIALRSLSRAGARGLSRAIAR